LVITNAVLEAIRTRRSVFRFETALIEDAKIQAILDAGRWAPSWLNRQPWRFILISSQEIKERISEYVPTVHTQAMKEAPICVAVSVNPEEDPYHYIEDGVASTQNMALAAHSLGLESCWIGIFHLKGEKNSAEVKIKEILQIPKQHRLISLLPIGVPKYVPKKGRKNLSKQVYPDTFAESI
jgi:nitroreductase